MQVVPIARSTRARFVAARQTLPSASTNPRLHIFENAPGTRCGDRLVVVDDEVGHCTGTVALEMKSLRREEDGFVGAGGFIGRQSFLRALHRALHRGFKAAIDPNSEVEVLAILMLKQKNSFQQNDVHVVELKYVRVKSALRLVRA